MCHAWYNTILGNHTAFRKTRQWCRSGLKLLLFWHEVHQRETEALRHYDFMCCGPLLLGTALDCTCIMLQLLTPKKNSCPVLDGTHLAAVFGVGIGHELRQEDVRAPDGAVPVPGQVAAAPLLVLVPLPEAQRILDTRMRLFHMER